MADGDERGRHRAAARAQLTARTESAAHHQLMNAAFNRWQLANAYGAFGTVTKERIEIVVEGDPRRGTGRTAHVAGVRLQGQAG